MVLEQLDIHTQINLDINVILFKKLIQNELYTREIIEF